MAGAGGGVIAAGCRGVCCCRSRKGLLVFGGGGKARPSKLPVPSPSRRSFGIMCMASSDEFESSEVESSTQKKVPIFVMMPIDSFEIDNFGRPKLRRVKALTVSFRALKLAGVHGIAVEVWWGIVERLSPFDYNWWCKGKGYISLPLWVVEIGDHNRDIYYQDQYGFANENCLTLGVDQIPLFQGRTALKCYEDFISSFVTKFHSLMGSVIEEVSIGLGPFGGLRYPSHPVDGRWKFPGIGEFQCYDKMEDLKMAANEEGKPEWGGKGPHNAGHYNSVPFGLSFFEGKHCFLSDYGQFFLDWYSGKLIQHADAILSVASKITESCRHCGPDSVLLVAKVGTIYWWYRTLSHAAELTAGYYNTALRDGYDPLVWMLSQHGVALHISCLEMQDSEIPSIYCSSPEGLLQQLMKVSMERVVHVTGRNAKERLDKVGLCQIIFNCHCHPQAGPVKSFTYFRMNAQIFQLENWNNFVIFVRKMNMNL